MPPEHIIERLSSLLPHLRPKTIEFIIFVYTNYINCLDNLQQIHFFKDSTADFCIKDFVESLPSFLLFLYPERADDICLFKGIDSYRLFKDVFEQLDYLQIIKAKDQLSWFDTPNDLIFDIKVRKTTILRTIK